MIAMIAGIMKQKRNCATTKRNEKHIRTKKMWFDVWVKKTLKILFRSTLGLSTQHSTYSDLKAKGKKNKK